MSRSVEQQLDQGSVWLPASVGNRFNEDIIESYAGAALGVTHRGSIPVNILSFANPPPLLFSSHPRVSFTLGFRLPLSLRPLILKEPPLHPRVSIVSARGSVITAALWIG
ncbi:hypothetical protein EYF80_064793 [Liparis tanakae]|uniref:Uncharacterized protein n=1 Tax=Liparis tanakae TaxID=230148 RepID=A0A4Z2E931_9TELE|nr:hypothetical protein EYF80_064793 [Liparis tanakae]